MGLENVNIHIKVQQYKEGESTSGKPERVELIPFSQVKLPFEEFDLIFKKAEETAQFITLFYQENEMLTLLENQIETVAEPIRNAIVEMLEHRYDGDWKAKNQRMIYRAEDKNQFTDLFYFRYEETLEGVTTEVSLFYSDVTYNFWEFHTDKYGAVIDSFEMMAF